VNINISTKLHKDGKEEEHKVRMHSAAGCSSIIFVSVLRWCVVFVVNCVFKKAPYKIIAWVKIW
jgi:hypothetical protein